MEHTSQNMQFTRTADAPMRITLSVDEAMVALSIGRTMLYSLLTDGSIASIKVGKKRLVLVQQYQ